MNKTVYRWALPAVLVGLTGVALAQAIPEAETETAAEPEKVLSEDVMPAPLETPKLTPLNPKWQAADFTNQEKSLGWTPAAFAVPKGMEERVQFWRDVYTKYTSEQGLLHDSLYVGLIYDSLDFTDITLDEKLSLRQKARARKKRVDEKKAEIAARLKRLGKLKDEAGLEGEDLRYWTMFAKIDVKDKFTEATKKGRLRFQLGQRDVFAKGVFYSGRYLRQMEDIFRSQGLPIELTRLPFVESSFNLRARSRVGASGIWQFMRSTARLYMRMDGSADERNDPLRATRAAAAKLRENYALLGSWPLAVTAYNHGPAGVKRLTEKEGTNDIVELLDVRRGRFKFASASFFASFLAALDVERHADREFGALEVMPEVRGAEVQLTKAATKKDLLNYFGGDSDSARALNPGVAESVWKGRTALSRKHVFRVPAAAEAQARAELE